jgi:hypothetical protein
MPLENDDGKFNLTESAGFANQCRGDLHTNLKGTTMSTSLRILAVSAVGAYSDNEKPPVDYHHCFRADHCSVDGLPFPLARRFVITRPATDRQVDWASTILQPS